MVLDGVIRASGDKFGNFGPLITPLFMGVVDDAVLFFGPGRLLDLRVQMIMPSLPTLLANATFEVFGDEGPPLGPIFADELDDALILFFGPGS